MFSKPRSSTLEDRDILKQYTDFGDFIGHNKLATGLLKYDTMSKQKRFVDLNNDYNLKKKFASQRRRTQD